jgi:hypothetical protein
MQSNDYLTVIECHEQISVDEIFETMLGALKGCKSMSRSLHCIQGCMSAFVPCITDEYARLRYLSFFMKKLLPELEISYSGSSEDLSSYKGISYACTLELKTCLLSIPAQWHRIF